MSKSLTVRNVGRFLSRTFLFIAICAVASISVTGKSYAASPSLSGAAGEFTALSPYRILDTRNGTGGFSSPVGQTPITVDINGRGGVPFTNVSAVVLNVTATGSNASSFLTVWPSGELRPNVSNVNFSVGQTVASHVTVKVGIDGKLHVNNGVGSTNVIFDVAGYYASAAGTPGSRYHTVTPTRLVDTRSGTGGVSGPIGQTPITVQGVNSALTLPDHIAINDVKAVVVNVTVTAPTSISYLTAWPGGESRPSSSNLNYVAGQTVANLVTVKVGPNGTLQIANAFGTAHLIIDAVGYYGPPYSGYQQWGRFFPASPTRVLDTRNGIGTDVAYACQTFSAPYDRVRPPECGRSSLQFGYKFTNAPFGTTPYASVFNVTATQSFYAGYLTFDNSLTSGNRTSNLNYAAWQTVANAATPPAEFSYADTESVQFNVYGGPTHVIVDLFGYFVRE